MSLPFGLLCQTVCYCDEKHHDQEQLEEERVCFYLLHTVVHHEGKSGQEHKAGTWTKNYGGMLFSGSGLCLASFYIHSKTTCARMVPPTVVCALTHQLIITNIDIPIALLNCGFSQTLDGQAEG